jgi:hypothetical protein
VALDASPDRALARLHLAAQTGEPAILEPLTFAARAGRALDAEQAWESVLAEALLGRVDAERALLSATAADPREVVPEAGAPRAGDVLAPRERAERIALANLLLGIAAEREGDLAGARARYLAARGARPGGRLGVWALVRLRALERRAP